MVRHTLTSMQVSNINAGRPIMVLNRAKLDELRRVNGIKTETELAKIIGVSPTTLWRITTGEATPSNGFIARVIVAFPHVPFNALFSVQRQGVAA